MGLSKQINPNINNTPSNSVSYFTMSTEQTFIAIKPDGVQRGLIGPIISRFEARGYKLAAIKLMTASQEHLEKHYEDLSSEPPTPSPPPQVPSAATTPSTSVATSATAPTASRTPRRRSLSGSRRVRFNRGSLLNTTGFTRSRFLIFWIGLIWI